MDEGLLSISPACCGQFVKMLITLEPHGIFRFNFAFIYFVQPLLCKTVCQEFAEHILVGQGLLVNMPITLEQHGIFNQILHNNTFNIIETLTKR